MPLSLCAASTWTHVSRVKLIWSPSLIKRIINIDSVSFKHYTMALNIDSFIKRGLDIRELKQTRRRRKRERHLKMWLRVSAIIFQLFKLIMLEKCALTILELNWNQRLGHKKTKLNICHHTLTSSTELQNRSFHVVERTRTSSKCPKNEKCTCKACKNTVFDCQICKFVGVLLPSSPRLLKLSIQSQSEPWGLMPLPSQRALL